MFCVVVVNPRIEAGLVGHVAKVLGPFESEVQAASEKQRYLDEVGNSYAVVVRPLTSRCVAKPGENSV